MIVSKDVVLQIKNQRNKPKEVEVQVLTQSFFEIG
jgi:hypothetical protein